jgi:hypothetical protein
MSLQGDNVIVNAHDDPEPRRLYRVYLNDKLVEHCWYADDEQGYCIREWHERVVITPPGTAECARAITEWCNGRVRIEPIE